QVVGIVADPGVGKSRLCFEFTERCRGQGIAVWEAHGLAHAQSVPFLPVLQFLRDYFGIEEDDDDSIAREKIAGRMLLLDEAFREALPRLFEFLNVRDRAEPAESMSAEARQRQLFVALNRLLRARSDEAPGVLLLEDLHWLDPGSEAFVTNLVEVLQALADGGELEGERGSYRLVRDVEEVRIPASVQSVLAARIDRLSERDKSVLQTAAVVGRTFSESVLGRVAGLSEEELRAAL